METRIFCIYAYLIAVYLNIVAYSEPEDCPKRCSCKLIPQREDSRLSRWLKLRCGDLEKISHFDELDLKSIASEILQLNLSYNSLTEFMPKVQLIALQKLDLSNNKLSTLFNNQFIEVPILKRLDISNNGLKRIEYAAFFSLMHLERLRLSQNQLTSFSAGTFEPMKSLKHLDISDNPLICDCPLMYALRWMENNSVKMLNNPRCEYPETHSGDFIRKLRIGVDISCPHITPPSHNITLSPQLKSNSPLSVQLTNTNQPFNPFIQPTTALLEGDEFTLHCKAVYTSPINSNNIDLDTDDAELQWTWLDSDPTKVFSDVRVDDEGVEKGSMVRVGRVRRAHAGVWKCAVVGSGDAAEAHTRLLVMGACPVISLATRGKGTFNFPPTPPSTTARQPCTVQTAATSTVTPSSIAMASLYCNSTGGWQQTRLAKSSDALSPELSACGWLSERTRVLQQFAQLQLKLQERRTLVETLRHFDNYTKQVIGKNADGRDGSEVMDLVFTVRTIVNFAKELRADTEHLAGPLLDIINGLLDLPDSLLAAAQLEDNSCYLLLEVLRIITTVAPSSVLQKSNVAMEAFSVKPESFPGLTCGWLQQPQDGVANGGRMFHCTAAPSVHAVHANHSNSNNVTIVNNLNGNRQLLASIQVPLSLFHQLHQFGLLPRPSSKSGIGGNSSNVNIVMATERIRVEMFGGGGLFPMTTDSFTAGGNFSLLREEITSPVVGFAIDNMTVEIPLTEPIYLILSTHSSAAHCLTPPRPVWYDPATNRWSMQGCHTLHHHSSALVFQCKQLGVYALQQTCNSVVGSNSGLRIEGGVVLGWVVGGTVILWLGLVGGLYGVWLIGKRRAKYRKAVPVRARHALINGWLALAVLTALFTTVVIINSSHISGSGRTCAALGVLMHYLTLCILLWACVGIDASHQRLRRRIVSIRTRGNLALLRLSSAAGQVPDAAAAATPPPIAPISSSPSPVPPETPSPHPPLLSIYLIGWGVAALLCGISAAVNVREYSSTSNVVPVESTCVLLLPLFPSTTTTSVGESKGGLTVTVWAPYVALTLVIMGMMVLVRVRCGQLRWLFDTRNGLGRMSEGDGTQATEQVDLELLEPPATTHPLPALINPSTPTSISSSHPQRLHHRWQTTTSCIDSASSDQSNQSDTDSTSHHHHHHNNSSSIQCLCCDPDVEWREVRKQATCLTLVVGMIVCSGGCLLVGGDKRVVWSVMYAVMAGVVAIFIIGVWYVWAECRTRKARSQWSQLFKRPSRHSPIFATSTPTIQQPLTTTAQPSTSVAIQATRPASSSNNSNTSNKQQYTNGNVAANETLLIVDNNQQNVVTKITNIEAAAARGQQPFVVGVPNIIENCTQSAEMFYNPHQSFVARRFFRKQKQQRSMQKRNNMMIARHQQHNPQNDRDIFAGNSSKVNNTNIHTELFDNAGGGTTGRRNRRRNLNMLCDNTEEDITADKGRRRSDRDRFRGQHKTRQNIFRDDPLQIQPQQLNMMRTVSQQCTLKYSSDNITGEIDFDGASATVLDKSLGSNPTEPTYCNVVEMKMQFAAAAAANASVMPPPDGMEKDNKTPRIFLNPMHNMYPLDSTMEHQPPDLLLTLDHTASATHNITEQQISPSAATVPPLNQQQQPQTPNTNQSTSAATMTATVSCSSVCPSELDELYQQIRGCGNNGSRRVGKSRSQIVLVDDDQQGVRYVGGGWLGLQHQWQSDSEVNNGCYYDDYRGRRACEHGRGKGKSKGETRL